MTIRLLLRKRFRKLTANSKGFSSVIGTTFMVLVIMLLSTSVFLWTLRQNTFYSEAIKEKNQLEVDRLNERVKAFNANYAVEDGDVSVTVELQNQGPLSVQIVNLWVVDVNTGNYNFSKSLSVNSLQPGGNAILTANVTIMGSASEHRFSSWLITGRGNVVPIEEKEVTEETITRANVTQGIGSIVMDMKQFKYYEFANTPPNGTTLDNPIQSFTISRSNYTILAVLLTNFDPSGEDINLTSGSYIWVITPKAGTIKHPCWNIAKVVNDTYVTNFDYKILPYGKQTWVYFGPTQPGSDFSKGVAPLFILLFGKIGIADYGQNIPFIALQFTS